ncbi:hypothetical protein, partial [Corynebacterium parakroppenstedtii]|uniref:hypothetical protein n=1 Tax=Corynebacterium parakroppenstedtii TaxID=2828363 RepID=UPI001F35031A
YMYLTWLSFPHLISFLHSSSYKLGKERKGKEERVRVQNLVSKGEIYREIVGLEVCGYCIHIFTCFPPIRSMKNLKKLGEQ